MQDHTPLEKKSSQKTFQTYKTVDDKLFNKTRRTQSLKNKTLEERLKKLKRGKDLTKQRIDRQVDMWSLGAILYYMIYGYPPNYNTEMI